MKILVTGATGFIGSQLVTDLVDAGFDVICCVRNIALAKKRFPSCKVISCDFYRDTDAEVWKPRLKNIDIVINVAGTLNTFSREKIWQVHFFTPRALFEACVLTGVKKVFQISALGIETSPLAFSESKKAVDDYLLNLPLTGLVIRPSLVYASGSFGGTSLLRGIAGLPLITPLPNKGKNKFQPIHIKDLTRSIINLLHKDLTPQIITTVGPEKISLAIIIKILRQWMSLKPTRIIKIPNFLMRASIGLCHLFRCPTLNRTSYDMLMKNNTASAQESDDFFNLIDFTPRKFNEGVFSHPSFVQDRWHARLYFLRPLLRLSIAFVWLQSALASWTHPLNQGLSLLTKIGVTSAWSMLVLYGAIITNGLLGLATLFKVKLKITGAIQCFLILAYTVMMSYLLPDWWWHPFSPIAKNIPLFVATLIMIALESDQR